jgi:hypothetical protein
LSVHILHPLYFHLLVFCTLVWVYSLFPNWRCFALEIFLYVHSSDLQDVVHVSLDALRVISTFPARVVGFLGRLLLVVFCIQEFLAVLLDSVSHLILVLCESRCILCLHKTSVRRLLHARAFLLFPICSVALLYISSEGHAIGVDLNGTYLAGILRCFGRGLYNVPMHILVSLPNTRVSYCVFLTSSEVYHVVVFGFCLFLVLCQGFYMSYMERLVLLLPLCCIVCPAMLSLGLDLLVLLPVLHSFQIGMLVLVQNICQDLVLLLLLLTGHSIIVHLAVFVL